MGKFPSILLKSAAAVTSGVIVAVLFPPFHAQWLAWVALMPLLAALWSLEGKRLGWKGFFLGWLAGIVSNFIQFRWIGVVSTLGTILLPLYLGLYWAAFGAIAARLKNGAGRSYLRVPFCLAATWAGLEILRGWLLTGFGWNGLGVAFHEGGVAAQAADLLGVSGLSMLPVFFQALLLNGLRNLLVQEKRRARLEFGTATLLIVLLISYGVARISWEKRGEKIRLKTLLVQLNIPQDAATQLWSSLQIHMAYEEETTKGLEALKKNDPQHWPDWVMWPECSLHGPIFRTDSGEWGSSQENFDTISQVRQSGPFQLLYGVNELESQKISEGQLAMKDKGKVWNSLAVMGPEDQFQTYRKHHLVIFGETIPFVDSVPFLRKIYEQQAGVAFAGSLTPGVTFDPLPVPTAKGEMLSAVPTICFEDTVPRLTRHFTRSGQPQIIVNVTNDGWFKESAAADQHFANARMRAIELRRPMLRCANSGVSAAIDSTGSVAHPDTGKPQILVDEKGNHFTRGSLLTELDVRRRPTFSLYAVIGDWGVISLSVLAIFWMRWRPRRPLPPAESPKD